jgi:MFS family permease
MLGLVQASFMLPGVLLSLPGGVLADKVDRRLFVAGLTWLLVLLLTSVALLTGLGWMTPAILVGHTFIIGSVFALMSPALQSIIQDMVRRDHLMQAVTLNSIALNVGRAVGPAIAGGIIAAFGVAWCFVFNIGGYTILGIVVARWRPAQIRQVIRESFSKAFAGAIRYGTRERRFRGTMARFLVYLSCGSALLSLMPLVAKAQLGGGPEIFGALLTWTGIGSILSAVLRDRVARIVSADGHARISAVAAGAATLLMAFATTLPVASAAALLYGVGWTNGAITYQVAAQMSSPAPMRGRAVSLFLMVFSFGIMIAGLFWGLIVDLVSMKSVLIATGALGLCLDFLCGRWRISNPPATDDDTVGNDA